MNKFLSIVKEFQQRFSFYRPLEVFFLSCLGAVNGVLEMLTVTALIPLLLLILDPEAATHGRILGFLYHWSGMRDTNEFAALLAVGLICFFTLKLVANIIIWRYEFKIIQHWRLRILVKLFDMVVHAKYSKLHAEDSSGLINILSVSVPYVVTNLFYNLMVLVNTFLLFLCLLSFSFLYSARTILFASAFGFLLICIFLIFKGRRMKVLGKESQDLSRQAIAILQKGIFGLKETKIALKQAFFAKKFRKVSRAQAEKDLALQFTQNLPTLVVEFISLVTILLVFISLLLMNGDVSQAASEISVLIFVGVRLIPLVNRVISAVSMMVSCEYPVRTILSFYDKLSPESDERPEEKILPLQFEKTISLLNVTFYYHEDAKKAALFDISLHICKGQHVGLVGPSGAGKSTIVNLLLGFLMPQSGVLLVDEQSITSQNINSFRKIVSFVDQAPFLMNDTYVNNIAYGEEAQDISLDRIKNCLMKVGLWDHVLSSPNELDFEIGENGKFLSGGQRQRLAIARALYKNAQLIILDEASSSLDIDSEKQLSELLESLKGEITIVSIAHRLSTLKSCDEVFFVEAGVIKAHGDFRSLYKESETFRRYIEHSNIEVDGDV